MLKQYQEEYATENVQFILTDKTGKILDTDEAFLTLDNKTNLVDIHPFFECFIAVVETLEDEVAFNCVHLVVDEKEYVTDIKFAKKQEEILVIISDHTAHYAAYQAIAQSRNESIINGELIAIKNAELEERERFKNSFIRNFSHELRNPLTSIIAITKIISDTELTTQQRNMLDFLKESNSNLKLLLEDILSISMISSGRLKLRDYIFSLNQLFDLITFTYRTKANDKGLEFEFKKDKKIPNLVEGDRLRLFQVITNLLDNAFKYTEKGKVLFEVQFNQKRANRVSMRFLVADTGVGIPEDSIDTIFQSFSQLNTASSSNAGTGLGLSIVKGLLTLMNSEIKVISTEQKGATFYFDIVLIEPLSLASSKTLKVSKQQKESKYKLRTDRKYRLLLAEDDVNVQTVLFKSLLNTNHFYIDLVSDGAMVMEKLINEDYDLILMDINLPNVTGDQLTRLIRDFPFKNIKNIPIIGITAHSYEDNFKSYKKSGMNIILSKPFEHDELLKSIAKLLK
tara:strand:+ start:123702 stop:125234 length:1533 start_codon:yes stop_codon:yes gene_type:complete